MKFIAQQAIGTAIAFFIAGFLGLFFFTQTDVGKELVTQVAVSFFGKISVTCTDLSTTVSSCAGTIR